MKNSIQKAAGKPFLWSMPALLPGWSFKKARMYGAEVEAVLKSDKCNKFLNRMYGDEPDIWHDGLTGMERPAGNHKLPDPGSFL